MDAHVGQALGYVASALVLTTFYMSTMGHLRMVAIASNVAFVVYGAVMGLTPILVLHSVLLPLNVLRLWQLRCLEKKLRAARAADFDPGPLIKHFRSVHVAQGTVLFRQGDPADCAYYITSGTVRLPELNREMGPGGFFGELGALGDDHQRTASAECATDCELHQIMEADLARAFYESPQFAFGVIRLVIGRLKWSAARITALQEQRPPNFQAHDPLMS